MLNTRVRKHNWIFNYQAHEILCLTIGKFLFSIFAQVNITNPTTWLVKFGVFKLLYSPTGEYNKTEIFKMAASRFVEVYWQRNKRN